MKKLDVPNKKLGRPNIPDDKKRVRLSTTISPETMEWFLKNKKDDESIGQIIDEMIKVFGAK